MIAAAVLIAWVPAVLVLVYALGPSKGATAAILAGWLLLPREYGWSLFGCFELGKRTVIGLAPLVAILIFDFPTLRKARPMWRDLPMAAFVALPPVGTILGGRGDLVGGIAQAWVHLTCWGLPYVVGRLYYSPGNGTRGLAIGVVTAALLTIPPLAYEAVAGPRHYLAGLIYGLKPFAGMVERLGGNRPEVFMIHGLELAAWMAMAAVLATWLAICRDGWRPQAYAASAALIVATLACRGVYGYATLAVGLVAALLTAALDRRWVLVALMLIPPSYAAARASGAWDGRVMASVAGRLGRESTVSVRLRGEGRFVKDAKEAGALVGAGGRYPEWTVDGLWATTFKGGGAVGLAAFLAAFLWPAAWSSWRRPPRSVETGLALFVILHVLDCLHNTSLIAPATLIGGALLGAPPLAPSGDGASSQGSARYRIP